MENGHSTGICPITFFFFSKETSNIPCTSKHAYIIKTGLQTMALRWEKKITWIAALAILNDKLRKQPKTLSAQSLQGTSQ